MRTQPDDWKETFIDTLLLAEARGSCVTMRSLLLTGDALISHIDDPSFAIRYTSIKQRMSAAFEYEASHGEGSFLRMDHPLNLRMVHMGILKAAEAPCSTA